MTHFTEASWVYDDREKEDRKQKETAVTLKSENCSFTLPLQHLHKVFTYFHAFNVKKQDSSVITDLHASVSPGVGVGCSSVSVKLRSVSGEFILSGYWFEARIQQVLADE